MNKNKFFVQTNSEGNTDYKIVLHLSELELGNVGAAFNPFRGMKSGGATITGTLEFVDNKSGETVCVVNFNKVKGSCAWSDKDRWSVAYIYLVKGVGKLVKKSK